MSSSSYPTWYCPVHFCAFSTTYSRNIRKHLKNIHFWNKESIEKVIDKFFEAYRNGKSRINNKPRFDPTNPIHWDIADLRVGREDRLSSRSVVGGGSGE